ncbi:hypothetical protein CONPUDRAFT_93998 [Coniophora puteana RWD-64-598 SS2]|uniref:DUF6533 domain-containing protein n=1 Tax=Coniophora puteana (strain RWD-64-598) TaxID=741705 RepID=R7SDK6_CONPW|nr:uncharacterized protein CONPUDRAFT_93998 [Coniophora puteana RWD-64-598 SS2]EIW74231.1 hypothetical protein CONPUDRAFT_93998 [Coniophora puteana RWD-64-598 SS2]
MPYCPQALHVAMMNQVPPTSGSPLGPVPVETLVVAQYALYCQVALTCAVWYDYVSVLPIEVNLVWKNQRSWGLLYTTSRYVGIAVFTAFLVAQFGFLGNSPLRIDESDQVHLALVWRVTIVIYLGLIQGIMVMRTYAIYGRSLRVFWFLVVCAIVELSVVLYGTVNTTFSIADSLLVVTIPIVIYQLLLLTMVGRIALLHWKRSRHFQWNSVAWVLVRDCGVHFLMLIVAVTVDIVMTADPTVQAFPPMILAFLEAIWGPRLALSIKEFNDRDIMTVYLTEMDFAMTEI